MAKHKGKSRLAVINVNETISVGALADGVVVKSDGDAFGRDFYWISSDLYWGMTNHTAAEGPLVVGLAHGDYTVAEIAEALNITGMENPGDKTAKEQGRRQVRRAGQFSGVVGDEVLNDGKTIRTRSKFMVETTQAPAFWAQNKSSATLTTGTLIKVSGKLYGRWA